MERRDVQAANRYLAAHEGWRVFGAAERTAVAIIQHLLAGVNAHTNLDLAVASAETVPGPAIHLLERDLQQISELQDGIASVAPLMWRLDIAGGQDETRLRDAAWLQALVLADLEGVQKEAAIGAADSGVSLIGARVLDPPGFLARTVAGFIARSETQDVARIIDALR